MLKDEHCQWVEDGEQLKSMENEYYKKVCTISGSWNTWRQTHITFFNMDLTDIQNHDNQVSN